jgi:radical SAM protein with 4Fe4S-binding SPASM domain
MNENFPKVSVIIPTYNRPQFIGRAVQSVLNQTYQNFELIIIDSSPNDETTKIVKNFNDKRIKYIKNKTKTILPVGRNQGVRESAPDSKYVAFLDDDNELLPQFLEKSIKRLEEKPELIGVVPEVEHIFDDGTEISKGPDIHEFWNTGLGNGAVLRKSLFTEENIWFDEKLLRSEEWDFGIRVLKNHKIESIPEALQIYHHHPVFKESTLSTVPLPLETIDYLFEKHFDYYRSLGRKPLSLFYFWVGKLYCRSGQVKKGRNLFLKAFFSFPKFLYVVYYLFWSFPKFAENFYFENLLHKILKFFKKPNNKINHKSLDIVPQSVLRGRETKLKRLIKSNRIIYRFFYKILRCNRYLFILRNYKRDTDSLFKTMSIETCSICNRQCPFCPVSQDKTPKGLMEDELFEKIIAELKELNFHGEIGLSNYGEPLLDKRLGKFVKRIKKELGSPIVISTNGDFLTKEKFRELLAAGIGTFHISQHDSEPSETIKNLFSQITPAEWKYISYEIVKEDSVTLANRGGSIEVKTLHPFYCNPQHIIVRSDGEVSFCCNDYYNEVKLGNVKEKKLIDIWNSPFYRRLRNEIKRGIFNLPICKRCLGIKS